MDATKAFWANGVPRGSHFWPFSHVLQEIRQKVKPKSHNPESLIRVPEKAVNFSSARTTKRFPSATIPFRETDRRL